MSDDMMEAVNLTHRVERALLQQKLDDAEQNLAIRDLKVHWMSGRGVSASPSHNQQLVDSALTGQYKIRTFSLDIQGGPKK